MKTTSIRMLGVLFAVLALTGAPKAQAATNSWNQANNPAVVRDWNQPTNWLPATSFPSNVDDVANLTIRVWQPQTINLNTGITVGTLHIYANDKVYTINSNTPNGALTFATTGASATLANAVYPYINTINAPIALTGDTLFDMYGVNPNGFGHYNGNYPCGLNLSGPISGNANVTIVGPDALWLGYTNNTFLGNVAIRQGYLLPANLGAGLGSAANAITLGSTGTFGHVVSRDSSVGLMRPLALSGAGGALHAYTTFGIGTNITGSGLLLLGKGTGAMIFSNTVDNTYVGDARVHGSYIDARVAKRLFTGNVTVQYFGYLRLHDANNVGGTVRVDRVSMPTPAMNVPAVLGLKGNNFFPPLDPNSSGVISLSSNSTAAVESALAAGAAQLGNGTMHYSSYNSSTFFGASLQPNLDKVFRFTSLNGVLTLDRSGGTAGVLTDVGGVPHAVEVNAWPTAAGICQINTLDANDFSGPLTINPGARFVGTPLTNGSPFGAGGGTVNLNAGSLYVVTAPAAARTMSKGALNLQGQCEIGFNSTPNVASLTFDTVTRSNRAILAVYAVSGIPKGSNLGGTERLIISNGVPAPINGMVAPWLIGSHWAPDTNAFVNYDTVTKLFTNAAFTSTSLATAGSNHIVNLVSGGTVPAGGTNIYALRTVGVLAGAPGDKLTIGSGGLILDGSGPNNNLTNAMNHTADIDFGGAEGVIWLSGNNASFCCNQLSGRISGSNGLTIGGPLYGNHATLLYITNNNAATLTGQITINEGRVLVTSTALGNSNNVIHLSSCGVPGNSDCRGATLGAAMGTVTITNPITLGPNGGVLEDGLGNLHLKGKISGPGGLAVSGFHDRTVQIYNSGNDWAGGTWVIGCQLWVKPGSKLGAGDVIVGNGGGRLYLEATNAIAPTARVALISAQFRDTEGVYLSCSGATWGSLEGNGAVWISYYPGYGVLAPSLLTIGGNDASTEFHGQIKDNRWTTLGYNNVGSLTKVGTGTFSLYGEVFLAGTTTVARGAMIVNGLVRCAKTIVDGTLGGAVLSGNGLIASNTVEVKNGGTVRGNLTMNALTLDSTSAVELDLNGAGVTQYDQLKVNGALDVGGCTLKLNLGFAPVASQTFTILTAGSLSANKFGGGGVKVSADYGGKTYWFTIGYGGNSIVLTHIPTGTVFSIR